MELTKFCLRGWKVKRACHQIQNPASVLRFAPFESVAVGESSAKFTFVQCPKYFAVAEDEIFCWRMIGAGMC